MAILNGAGNTMIRHYKYILPAVLLSLLLLACGTYKVLLPTPEQLAKSGIVTESLDMASLRRGRALAITECAGCHRFFYPGEYSPEEWSGIILKKAKRLALGNEQMEDIDLYYSMASTVAP